MRPTRHTTRDSTSPPTTPSTAPPIPLISFSRTPSPSPYRARPSRSATQSEDSDYEPDVASSSQRPLVGAAGIAQRRWAARGGLGAFLFGSWAGWQVWVAALVLYVGGAGYALVLLNRFVLWSEYSRRVLGGQAC